MGISFTPTELKIGKYTLKEISGGFIFDGNVESTGFSLNFNNGQGSVAGYVSGGGTPVEDRTTRIDKFTFSSTALKKLAGSLTAKRANTTGQSSSTHGYTSGGYDVNFSLTPFRINHNTIDRFPFSADANATDVGDLTQGRRSVSGHSSLTHGYTTGGSDASIGSFNTIDKFPFASTTTNASDVGDLSVTQSDSMAGHSSLTHGYTTGGAPSSRSNVMEKFPFATDSNATDIGDLALKLNSGSGQNSDSAGYTSGGFYYDFPTSTPIIRNSIQKFPFATDSNSTDVADLSAPKQQPTGVSSLEHGYNAGGNGPSGNIDGIDRFPFATDSNAVNTGNLLIKKSSGGGQQY